MTEPTDADEPADLPGLDDDALDDLELDDAAELATEIAAGLIAEETSDRPLRRVAAFDFDETLTRRDTLVPFLVRVAGPPRFAAACVKVLVAGLRGQVALRDRDAVKERLLAVLFAGRPEAQLRRLAEQYARTILHDGIDDATLARLRAHLDRGDEVIFVSASLEYYLRPVADTLGIHDVIGVELAAIEGMLTGELAHPNVRAEQKAVRLRERLGQPATGPLRGIELWAYGNSSGDHALLEMADHPFWRGRPAKLPSGSVQFGPEPLDP